MSIFDFATSGLRLRTLSSVAPTNMPVPAWADPAVTNAARTASNTTLRTRGEYSVGESTVGPNRTSTSSPSAVGIPLAPNRFGTESGGRRAGGGSGGSSPPRHASSLSTVPAP